MAARHSGELGAMAQRMQDIVGQMQDDTVKERQLAREQAVADCEERLRALHGEQLQQAQRKFA